MIIRKGTTEYTVKEQGNNWILTYNVGKVTAEYKVPKDVCIDEAQLREYVATESIF